MNENHACLAVMDFQRIRRHLCLPRYTPRGWWECDVFELTAGGYFREYEVKLSLADFKKDADKQREKGPYHYGEVRPWEKKHDLLAAGHEQGPSQFSFVAPENMLVSTDIPQWAGWFTLYDRGEGHRPSHRYSLTERIKAPKLHTTKAHEKLREDVMSCCYYRFHDALRQNHDNCDIRCEWKDEPAPEVVP